MKPTAKEKSFLAWALRFSVLFVICFFLDVCIGDSFFSFHSIHEPDFFSLLTLFRLPRALTCTLAGVGLSVGGLLMQSVFRNPLAGPDVLGLSSGASLAVALTLMGSSFFSIFLHSWSLIFSAALGSFFIFLLIFSAAQRVSQTTSLLIIGIMLAAISSSLVSVLLQLSSDSQLKLFTLWTMGNVEQTTLHEAAWMAIFIVPALGLSLFLAKSLNAFWWGDVMARSMGISVKRDRLWVMLATCVMTGAVTAFCGPIAFVGLAVPHVVKSLIKSNNYQVLIPLTALGGASLLLMCDVYRQAFSSYGAIPLNAMTALFGAPVVIRMLWRGQHEIRV